MYRYEPFFHCGLQSVPPPTYKIASVSLINRQTRVRTDNLATQTIDRLTALHSQMMSMTTLATKTRRTMAEYCQMHMHA